MFTPQFRHARISLLSFLVGLPLIAAQGIAADAIGQDIEFDLTLRRRIEAPADSGQFQPTTHTEKWNAARTAVIVCDMWDLHHCKNAVTRVKEMAPRMNQVLEEARKRGALIIHAPSSCMDAYQDHPARKRAQTPPKVGSLPPDIGKWCDKIPSEDKGKYPIDQSDGGEDDDAEEHRQWAKHLADMGRDPRAPWKRQIDILKIQDLDAITDSGVEVWNLLEERGINNVVLMGVHVNMCVLGRPFGLRQMAKNGKNVVLVRDLTDSMYNPARWPYVNHYRGTDLMIEHIEKFVCPTVTSDQIIGGNPFTFSGDPGAKDRK